MFRRRFPAVLTLVCLAGLAVADPSLTRAPLAAARAALQTRSVNVAPYMLSDHGVPVRWRCGDIRVVVNPSLGGPGALDDARRAVQIAAEITGLPFVYAGTSTRTPRSDWYASAGPGVQPPVLVGWATPNGSDLFETDAEAGAAVANPATYPDGPRIVTGVVAINAARDDEYVPGFAAGRSRGVLLLHELLHVAGLGHVAAPGHLMSAELTVTTPASLSPQEQAMLLPLTGRCR